MVWLGMGDGRHERLVVPYHAESLAVLMPLLYIYPWAFSFLLASTVVLSRSL
jgi:hypothetical protein